MPNLFHKIVSNKIECKYYHWKDDFPTHDAA